MILHSGHLGCFQYLGVISNVQMYILSMQCFLYLDFISQYTSLNVVLLSKRAKTLQGFWYVQRNSFQMSPIACFLYQVRLLTLSLSSLSSLSRNIAFLKILWRLCIIPYAINYWSFFILKLLVYILHIFIFWTQFKSDILSFVFIVFFVDSVLLFILLIFLASIELGSLLITLGLESFFSSKFISLMKVW